MNRRPHRVRLEVQPLEGRALLSTMGHAAGHGVVELAKVSLTKLSASLTGRFVLGADQITLTLRQGSTVQKLGAVKGGGSLSLSAGMIDGGTLTLASKKGQLVLHVAGPVSLPTTPGARLTLNLTVASGTGVFGSLSGAAVARFTVQPKTPTTGNFTGTVKTA